MFSAVANVVSIKPCVRHATSPADVNSVNIFKCIFSSIFSSSLSKNRVEHYYISGLEDCLKRLKQIRKITKYPLVIEDSDQTGQCHEE